MVSNLFQFQNLYSHLFHRVRIFNTPIYFSEITSLDSHHADSDGNIISTVLILDKHGGQ